MKLALAALVLSAAFPMFAQAEPVGPAAFLPIPVVGQFACTAQNARGQIFREIGLVPEVVQQRAMTSCRVSSAVCQPLGCRRI